MISFAEAWERTIVEIADAWREMNKESLADLFVRLGYKDAVSLYEAVALREKTALVKLDKTRNALRDLHGLVMGECPSLLEDDHHDSLVRFVLDGEESVDGPSPAMCNDMLGKPGHYKARP